MMRWSKEDVARLYDARAEGKSVSQMMEMFPGRTREAIHNKFYYDHRRTWPKPPRKSTAHRLVCTNDQWIARAMQAAVEDKVRAHLVLAGDKRQQYKTARWKAFKRLSDENYSYSSIGKASGFCHTSVRHGCLEITRLEASC